MSQRLERSLKQIAGAVMLAGGLAGMACFATSGFAGSNKFSTISVDRTHKGDRLSPESSWLRQEHKSTTMKLPSVVPSGCDPAFSPVADPQRSRIFGRCVA